MGWFREGLAPLSGTAGWKPTRGAMVMIALLHLLIVAGWVGYLWLRVVMSAISIQNGDLGGQKEPYLFFVNRVDTIQGLALIWGIACVAVLTFAIPTSVHGTFSRARLQGYFDQVILSGVSPYRFWIRQWLVSLFTFSLVVGSTAPYITFCLGTGGPWAWTFVALFLLGAYATALALVTMALMLYISEGAAVFVVLAFTVGSTWFLAGYYERVFVPLQLSPLNAFIAPWIEALQNRFPDRFYEMYQVPLSHALIIVTLCTMAWLILVSAVALWLGPLSLLTRELAGYDQAVFPGDRDRFSWFRQRKGLRWQAGISFLYENRPTSLLRADFRRRWLWREFVFLSLILVGWLAAVSLSLPDFYKNHLWLGLGGGLLNAIVFTETRVTERCRMGRWEAWQWNQCCFMLNCVILVFLAGEIFWRGDFPSWQANLQNQIALVAAAFAYRSILQALGMQFPCKIYVVMGGLLLCAGLVSVIFLLVTATATVFDMPRLNFEHAPWYGIALFSVLVGLVGHFHAHRRRRLLPSRLLI